MIKEAIYKTANHIDLGESDMMGVMDDVMEGKTTPAQIASFVTALRMKGETVDEVTGAARIMRKKAVRIDVQYLYDGCVRRCGSGHHGCKTR
jgi:anthranilate phosphoribosyltransferase